MRLGARTMLPNGDWRIVMKEGPAEVVPRWTERQVELKARLRGKRCPPPTLGSGVCATYVKSQHELTCRDLETTWSQSRTRRRGIMGVMGVLRRDDKA